MDDLLHHLRMVGIIGDWDDALCGQHLGLGVVVEMGVGEDGEREDIGGGEAVRVGCLLGGGVDPGDAGADEEDAVEHRADCVDRLDEGAEGDVELFGHGGALEGAVELLAAVEHDALGGVEQVGERRDDAAHGLVLAVERSEHAALVAERAGAQHDGEHLDGLVEEAAQAVRGLGGVGGASDKLEGAEILEHQQCPAATLDLLDRGLVEVRS